MRSGKLVPVIDQRAAAEGRARGVLTARRADRVRQASSSRLDPPFQPSSGERLDETCLLAVDPGRRGTVALIDRRSCSAEGTQVRLLCPDDRTARDLRQEHAVGLRHGDRRVPEVAPGEGLKFSIQCEDDQGRADDGINLARKFVEDKSVVVVLGSWSSTVTLAAAPVYNEGKLVNITPISSHPDVTKVSPYVFRQSLVQSQEGAFNGASLWKLGARSIAMLGIPNDYGKANMALTRRGFETQGGKVVFERVRAARCPGLSSDAAEGARAKIPTGSTIGAFAPQTALILKQLRQMGIKTPVFVCAADDTPDLARLAGTEAIEGTHLTVQTNPVLGPELADFYKRYEARYSRLPDPFAANSYNTAMMMMTMAAQQYLNVSRESIRKGL